MAPSSPVPVVVDDVGANVVVDGGVVLPEDTLTNVGCSITCSICDASFRPMSFWCHMHNFHIARNGQDYTFLKSTIA